jgi:hypothetical protein
MDNHFSQQRLLNKLSCLHGIFLVPAKNKVVIVVWVHFWVLYSVPLVFMSVFVPVACWVFCYCFVIQFEVEYCDTPAWLFFLSVAFAIGSILCLQVNLRVDFSVSVMKIIGILMGVALNM